MGFTDKYTKAFKYLLPAPFTIAVGLTILTFFIALFFTFPQHGSYIDYSLELLTFWEGGLWNNGLLVFAIQMMLMLVLGHTLALTKPVNNLINLAVKKCNNTAKAAALVTLLTVIVSLFNWGLGLIFGAIFARKVAEHAKKNNININYPIIGAAGYSGLMVWHGGLSGSSLAKVAEPNHIKEMMTGIISDTQLALLPESISYSETVGSTMNIVVMLAVVLILPLAMYWMGKRTNPTIINLNENVSIAQINKENLEGAEKLDHSQIFSLFFGGIILLYIFYKISVDYHFDFLLFLIPTTLIYFYFL